MWLDSGMDVGYQTPDAKPFHTIRSYIMLGVADKDCSICVILSNVRVIVRQRPDTKSDLADGANVDRQEVWGRTISDSCNSSYKYD